MRSKGRVGESEGGDVRVPAMVSSVSSNNNGDETASFPLSPMLVSKHRSGSKGLFGVVS
jgi:hypothetical protein